MFIILRYVLTLMVLIAVATLTTGCGQTKLEDELLDETGVCFEFHLKCGEEHDDKFDSINDRVSKLEALASLNARLIEINESNIDLGEASFQIIVDDLQNQITALSNQQAINTSDILVLQNAISDLEDAQQRGVAEVIDPCGDNPGQFDEVIIRLHDGTFIAYFESGGKRFLSVLGDGSYRTTDRQRCGFSIINGELID